MLYPQHFIHPVQSQPAMISTNSVNSSTKFFTHYKNRPSLKYTHTTASHLDAWLALLPDPNQPPPRLVHPLQNLGCWHHIRIPAEPRRLIHRLQRAADADRAGRDERNYFLLSTRWMNLPWAADK